MIEVFRDLLHRVYVSKDWKGAYVEVAGQLHKAGNIRITANGKRTTSSIEWERPNA